MMIKLLKIKNWKLKIALASVFIFFTFTAKAQAFTCHVTAGGGNWDSASTWENCNSTIPQAQDDVVLDATSGSVVVNATTNLLKSFDMTGYVATLSGTSNLRVAPSSGSTVVKFGGTISWTGTLTLSPSNTATTTLTSNGKTITTISIAAASGAHVVLADSLTMPSATGSFTLTTGYLHMDGASDNSGLTHSIRVFTHGNATSFLGNSSINLVGASATVWNKTAGTLFAGNSTITLTGVGSVGFNGGGSTYYSVVYNGPNISSGISGANTFTNLSLIGQVTKTSTFSLSADQVVTGTLTLTGNSVTNRPLLFSATLGTPRTITVNGTVSASNVDFRDIVGAGSASWDLSNITGGSGDALGNSNITFTPAQINYWIGGTGSWSDSTKWCTTSGGCADGSGDGRVPLPQDDAMFDANSFTAASQIVTLDMPRAGKDITWSGVTNTPRFNGSISSGHTMYGSLTMVSDMIGPSHTLPLIFEGRGSHTLTSAGRNIDAITVNMFGGTLTLQDAVPTLAHGFTLTTGTFNANNYNISSNRGFTVSGTSARTLVMGSGTWSTGDSFSLGFVASTITNLTFSADTSTILFSNPGSNNYNFSGGGLRYYNVVFGGAGSGTVTVSGNNYFNKLTINDPRTVKFTSGTTNTFNRFEALGESGSTILLQSVTSGSVATLSMPGANTFVGDYLAITDVNAAGGAKWYAGANSTLSNSSGWLLQAGPQRRGSFIQDAKVRLEKGKMIIRGR